jgi:two-component system, OmpR family, response regulator
MQKPLATTLQLIPEPSMNTWSQIQPQRRQRFLVVEDEQDIADLVALHLSDLNADVATVQDGAEGLARALQENWDAVLLDLRLPNIDGLDICRTLRAQASYVPIMMLTSRSTELDRVLGLEIGADDYLIKPFSVAELKARVKALVRRSQQATRQTPSEPEQIQRENLFLDKSRRIAKLADNILDLTAREFDLLWHFANHPGKVYKRSELLDQVWGYGHDGYEHTVNSHINRLRSKLETDPGNPYFIETIWGVGYRFREFSK